MAEQRRGQGGRSEKEGGGAHRRVDAAHKPVGLLGVRCVVVGSLGCMDRVHGSSRRTAPDSKFESSWVSTGFPRNWGNLENGTSPGSTCRCVHAGFICLAVFSESNTFRYDENV